MPTGSLLAAVLVYLAAVLLGARAEASPAVESDISHSSTGRRLNLESCPEFVPVTKAPVDNDQSKAPMCTWHVGNQECFLSGINSQDNSFFNDIGFNCAMSQAVGVKNGHELLIRGRLEEDPDSGPVELHFLSQFDNKFKVCNPQAGSDKDYDFCEQRHFKVENGGKLKLMNLHLKGGDAVKGRFRCKRYKPFGMTTFIAEPCLETPEITDTSCSYFF